MEHETSQLLFDNFMLRYCDDMGDTLGSPSS